MKALQANAEFSPKTSYDVSEWEKATHRSYHPSQIWKNLELSMSEVADPTPEPRQVILEVKACGVCGSDLHICGKDHDGYTQYEGLLKMPIVLGHEFSGKVIEVGRDVTTLRSGDKVAVQPIDPCGRCNACRAGLFNHCTEMNLLGFTYNGGLATYVAAYETACWKIDAIGEGSGSESKMYEFGALCEPIAISYNAIFKCSGGFLPGANASVFGAGPIGLSAIALMKAAGAGLIVAFEPSKERRELALRIGATHAYDPMEVNAGDQLIELSKGEGFDFHLEACGKPKAFMTHVERALTVGAKIGILGRSIDSAEVKLENLIIKRATIFGSHGPAGDSIFPNVIRMMAQDSLDISSLITDKPKLEEMPDLLNSRTKMGIGKTMAIL